MVFQKITSSSLTESRFGDPFEMDEDMEILFKDGDPILDDPELRAVPITIKINAVDTACWLVIRLADKNTLRVNQKDGKYFEVYVIVPITHTTKDTQKASDIEAEVDKKLVVKSGKTATGLQLVIQLAKSIYKDDAYAIYETTYLTSTETNTTMNKPSVKFASTYEYLLGKDDDKYNRVPVRTIPKQADELIQLYTDNYDTPLPGETKRWDITAEKERKAKEVVDLAAFQKEVLPEFIALIVISPEKKAHTFVYWSGDPHDAKAS
ncbi:MAG TPA: hypothetical protein VFJ43_06510, partial [Bacteroidia bacterium]|nr:hypothetical protein [Bacteroidia bacterium]